MTNGFIDTTNSEKKCAIFSITRNLESKEASLLIQVLDGYTQKLQLFILDFSDIGKISSVDIKMIMEIHKDILNPDELKKGELRIVCDNPFSMDTFITSHVIKHISIFSDINSAIEGNNRRYPI